jgi:cytochrome b involved in lipid metabolism
VISGFRILIPSRVTCGSLPVNHDSFEDKMAQEKLLSTHEISSHKTPDDCWIVVDNQVWDVTEFLSKHPGGPTSE